MLIFHALIISFSNALPFKKITCSTLLYTVHLCLLTVLCLFMILFFISLVDDTVICHLICHLHLININCALRDQFCHQKMAQRVCKWQKYEASVPKIAARHLISFSQTPQMLLCIITARLTSFWSLRHKEVVFNNHTAFIGKLTK